MFDGLAFGREVVVACKGYVEKALVPLLDRLAALEARAPERGEKGEKGDHGAPGQRGPMPQPDEIRALFEDFAATIELPKPEPITREQILDAIKSDASLMAEAVAAHLEANPPVAGKDGQDGIIGPAGKDAEPPSPEAISEAVASYLEANPPAAGKDGSDGVTGLDGKDGAPGLDGKDGVSGIDGKDGRDGVDGKDGESIKGEPGEKGADGRDGVGMAGALIDREGEFVVTLSNGETRKLGRVVGKDGSPSAEVPLAPDDVAEQVAKAIKLVAESPTVAAKGSAVVLNINSAPKTKTITTRRDKDGNLVADVVENRV